MELEQIKYALALATTIMNLQTGAVIPPQAVIPMTQTEAIVREYFADAPVMVEVARCESSMRQFDAKGKIIKNWNKNGTYDQGLFEINSIHIKEAKRLGYDVGTLEGNLGFARKLYEAQGVKPWLSSSKCWHEYTGKKGVV